MNRRHMGSPMELREEMQRGLGELCMEFSKLETMLTCAIGYFVSAGEASVGHIVAAETSFKAKVGLFSSLFQLRTRDPTVAKRLKEFRKSTEGVEHIRNQLVHSLYWPNLSRTGTMRRIKTTAKPSKGLQFQVEEVTPEQIADAVRNVRAVTETLNNILLCFHPAILEQYLEQFYKPFEKK